MIRYLLGSTVLVGAVVFNTHANAADPVQTPTMATPTMKINGNSSFNAWFFNNTDKYRPRDDKNEPFKRQKYGGGHLFTVDDARIRFTIEGKTDPGMDYGFVVVLDGNVNAEKNVRENYLFVGGSWGKIYAGNTIGVESTMSFGGFDQWGGTGFISGGDFDRVVNYTFGTLHSINLVGSTSRDTKFTYLTPRWNGIQAGISYTPRTEHRGEQEVNTITSSVSPQKPFDTDNIASGINFIHKFENGFEMDLSATSIFAAHTHPEFLGNLPRKKTASFAFGGTFSYADIGFSLEYGNNGRSREYTPRQANAGQFLDFGLSYTWGATEFSTGYYYGWRKALGGPIKGPFKTAKAKTNAVTGAIDHKLAPGLGVYLEYAYFHMKNPAAKAEAARVNDQLKKASGFFSPVKNNNASVFVIGSRIVF